MKTLKRRIQLLIPYGEKFSYLIGAAVLGAWIWGARPIPDSGPKSYHFKGEFCGVTLWEYSARGDALTIWTDFVTNSDLTVHLTVRSNSYEGFLRAKTGK